jgi:hypothetical protein
VEISTPEARSARCEKTQTLKLFTSRPFALLTQGAKAQRRKGAELITLFINNEMILFASLR